MVEGGVQSMVLQGCIRAKGDGSFDHGRSVDGGEERPDEMDDKFARDEIMY